MTVAVLCNTLQQQEIQAKPTNKTVDFTFCVEDETTFSQTQATVYLNLLNERNIIVNKPEESLYIINAVNKTLTQLPKNSTRINGWNGFIKRNIIELCAPKELETSLTNTMTAFGWKFIFVPDVVGMIAPRIISMIINEAYFGFEDKISTKEEIDIAMQLGTNYPYGPFEWANKIGKTQIVSLLQILAKEDKRYVPASHLLNEAQKEEKNN
jgi:3-hydroxybutyryl-CoA dehydrogenase